MHTTHLLNVSQHALWRCACQRGTCPGGFIPACVWGRHPPPVDRKTPVKTQPSQTSFEGGKYIVCPCQDENNRNSIMKDSQFTFQVSITNARTSFKNNILCHDTDKRIHNYFIDDVVLQIDQNIWRVNDFIGLEGDLRQDRVVLPNETVIISTTQL